ncbi:hypothetical protein LRS13_17040 [Svornostia abyssi]|uniref:Uncharacterized protein n=1 Tax=Svornostia abyssi TaxID=2898438 RepID=A0ABY5PCJ7_9ACTN|nr:hypothetical protein LRS13_17040 [Parviterribacteraceae bacterium J379]
MPRALLFTAAAAGAVAMMPTPATAATCGVAQSRALFETPEVQVFASKGKAVACLRATGRSRVVGPRSSGRATTLVRGVAGGRWLSIVRAGAGGTDQADLHQLIDLRSGRRAQVAERRNRVETVTLPGVLIHALGEGRGVVARSTSGRTVVLSRVKGAEGIAAAGNRVYWLEPSGGSDPKVRSARLSGVPTAAGAATGPAAQTIGSCPADADGRLLLHDRSRVVTQRPDGVRVCNRWTGKTWNVGDAQTTFTALTTAGVAYRSPTSAGLLRFSTSARVELPLAADAPSVASEAFLVGATPDGLRAANAAKSTAPAEVLDAGSVTDVAAALVPASDRPEDDTVVYWTDADGKARTATLPVTTEG